MSYLIRALLALSFVACLQIGAAQAQIALPTSGGEATTPVADLTSPEAVRDIVSRMSDAEVRDLLLERLDAVAAEAAEEDESAGLLAFAERATLGVTNSVFSALSKTPLIVEYQARSVRAFHDKLGTRGIIFLFVVFGAAITLGLIVENTFYRLTRRWRRTDDSSEGQRSLRQTVVFLLKRLSTDVVGVIVFFFAASTFGPIIGFNLAPSFFETGERESLSMVGEYIGGMWLGLIIIPRFGAAVGRLFFSPRRPQDRLLYIDDASARILYVHQIGLLFLAGFAGWIIQFNELNGMAMQESGLGFWLGLSLHVYLGWIAWRARAGITMMMRGADPDVTPTENRAAQVYPYFVMTVAAVSWLIVEIVVTYEMWDLLAGAPQIKMMLLLAYAPIMDTMIRGLVRHLVPPMTGEGVLAERAYRATKHSYIRIGRILVFALVIALIGEFWGVDFANLAEAGVGAQFAGRLIEIMMILSVGYLLWELASLWINRKLAAEQTAAAFDLTEDEPGGGEGGGAGSSRLSTVLPLLLGVMKAAIATIVGLIALGNIGIDITPLLAGAGIVGLAVGFGAQKLVADVVGGIFFLIDDAFRTGEYVEVEGTVGTVEKISIRSMQLRHHKGPVHTIPYGEIPKITNYSRDWVIMKLKFTVPFETDPNKVKKLFKQIGKDMQAVPEYAADLLQPFKSQGVFDFDDVGMIIRGKFMAKPGKQFTLRKEIYNRVKKAFADNGIDFARREVRVAIPGLESADQLNDEQKQAIAAAASEVAQQEEPAPPAKP